MAFVISDRIKETSTTTGTGTLTLAGAVTGFASFAAVGNGNTCTYGIIAVDANGVPTGEWETGIGTYTSSGATLSRGVIKSSNSNALVSFSAGTKHVICTDVAGYTTPLVMATTTSRAIQVADQTALSATAGNARGSQSIDLQMKRGAAAQVASGSRSTICGGESNTASGVQSTICAGSYNTASGIQSTICGGSSNQATQNSATVSGGRFNYATGSRSTVCGGYVNTASATYSSIGGGYSNKATATAAVIGGGRNNKAYSSFSLVCGGKNNQAITQTYAIVVGGLSNVASGLQSFIGGGGSNVASSRYSVVCGGVQAKADKWGQFAQSSGILAVNGDAQGSSFVLRTQTTNATQTSALPDGVGGTNHITLSNDTTWTFNGLIVARRTDTDGTNSGWTFQGVIKRDTNAASTALVGTCVPTLIMQDAGAATWAVDVTADTTNGALRIRVTGEAAKTINWVVTVNTVETTG